MSNYNEFNTYDKKIRTVICKMKKKLSHSSTIRIPPPLYRHKWLIEFSFVTLQLNTHKILQKFIKKRNFILFKYFFTSSTHIMIMSILHSTKENKMLTRCRLQIHFFYVMKRKKGNNEKLKHTMQILHDTMHWHVKRTIDRE